MKQDSQRFNVHYPLTAVARIVDPLRPSGDSSTLYVGGEHWASAGRHCRIVRAVECRANPYQSGRHGFHVRLIALKAPSLPNAQLSVTETPIGLGSFHIISPLRNGM